MLLYSFWAVTSNNISKCPNQLCVREGFQEQKLPKSRHYLLKSQQLSLLSILSVSIGSTGGGVGEPFWVDPPEGWYHVALCRLADFFANHNYKKVKVKNHLFVPSNTNGQSLQVGPKTCFLTSHHVNRMLGSKNPSKIQNWHPNFFSSTTIP